MANFNKTAKKVTTTTHEGGKAYNKSLSEDWLNFLMSCMLEDRFYEDGASQTERYLELTDKMADKFGNEFIAKASMFARNELGMRSISQLTAAWLNNKKFVGKRHYFKSFCHRADDVAEVFAAIDSIGQKRSHACVRGFGDYLSQLDEYAIDKYKMNNKQYSMFDCINICHPKSAVIDAYKRNAIEKAGTWEQEISACSNEVDKAKKWYDLVVNKKLGYMALLRNLRNIFNSIGNLKTEKAQELCMNAIFEQLVDEYAIKKSLIFPYQIYSSYKALVDYGINRFDLMGALSKAFRISTGNMPKLDGENVIMLDVSGSMDSLISGKSTITIKEVGAVYATAILIANKDTEIIKFGTSADIAKVNLNSNVFDIVKRIAANDNLGYGTGISKAFEKLDHSCNRIFLISDMQIMDPDRNSWCGDKTNGQKIYNEYVKNYGQCKMYSFDLGNYSTQVANPKNKDVSLFTSLSSKVFDFISLKEDDIDIVDYINSNYTY